MKTTRWTILALAVSVLAFTGATCDKNAPGPESEAPISETAPAKSTAADNGGSGEGGNAAAQPAGQPAATGATEGNPALALSGINGLDFSSLPPSAQKELADVFSDEFCYCGCPHTLGACLKTHTTCKHAKRMALLAAAEAAEGAPSTEIIVTLSKYYMSFRDRVKLKADPRMCVGSADAKVTLVEFSDFECPFCGAARPMLEDFVSKHPETRLCYAPFPLSAHPNALPAAQAALFASEHGKFWEMHDALFEHQTELSREKILELAGGIGLDKKALASAIDSGQYLDEAKASKQMGIDAGVNATPTVFVNGRKFLLGLSTEALKHTVEDELEWQRNNGGWDKD